MKPLITMALALALLFASTFLVATTTGLLTVENIEVSLKAAAEAHWIRVVWAVVLLLLVDIVIAVPTLTIATLSGYFLGFGLGALSAITGMLSAGMTGYAVSRLWGPALLKRLYPEPQKREDMQRLFNNHGPMVLLLCRAMPVLPEVACCMAGANRMPFSRFMTYYMGSTLPYAGIAAYAGANSSLDNPQPAIIAAIGLSVFFWSAWLVLLRCVRRRAVSPNT